MEDNTIDTVGCDSCKYRIRHRCKLWDIRIDYPHDSYCESYTEKINKEGRK